MVFCPLHDKLDQFFFFKKNCLIVGHQRTNLPVADTIQPLRRLWQYCFLLHSWYTSGRSSFGIFFSWGHTYTFGCTQSVWVISVVQSGRLHCLDVGFFISTKWIARAACHWFAVSPVQARKKLGKTAISRKTGQTRAEFSTPASFGMYRKLPHVTVFLLNNA